jgi:hypothetical protein
MLNQFESIKKVSITSFDAKLNAQGMTTSPSDEFNQAITNPEVGLFPQRDTDINELLSHHEAFPANARLTAEEAWFGEMQKSERPELFTHGIVASCILPSSIVESENHKAFFRLSLQPSWVTGRYVVVKEETHVLKNERKVLFLGREVNAEEAITHLLPAILSQAPLQKVLNTQEPRLGDMTSEQRESYIKENFNSLFLSEKPALFHVAHGIQGAEEKPIETWLLVRLAQAVNSTEQQVLENLKTRIEQGKNIRMYQQTLQELADKKAPKP